jgi:hypothetical protein
MPPFIPVSAVVVTSRLQFTTTEGCSDTFDQIVYMNTGSSISHLENGATNISVTSAAHHYCNDQSADQHQLVGILFSDFKWTPVIQNLIPGEE